MERTRRKKTRREGTIGERTYSGFLGLSLYTDEKKSLTIP